MDGGFEYLMLDFFEAIDEASFSFEGGFLGWVGVFRFSGLIISRGYQDTPLFFGDSQPIRLSFISVVLSCVRLIHQYPAATFPKLSKYMSIYRPTP